MYFVGMLLSGEKGIKLVKKMAKSNGTLKSIPSLTDRNLELSIANLALVKTNKFLEEFQKRLSRQGDADKAELEGIIRKEIEKNLELKLLIKQAAKEASITRASEAKMRQSYDLLHVSKNVLSENLKKEKAMSDRLKSELITASSTRIADAELQQKDIEIEQLNREIETIAKISSHDLQEPLKNIQVFSSLLIEKEANNLSDRGRDYFSRMQTSATRVRKLIQDLSEYSHLNKSFYKIVKTDLNTILKEAKKELQVAITKTKAEITSVKLPSITVSPLHFRKVFKELIYNAIKFAKPGTNPKIHIRCDAIKGSDLKELRLNNRKTNYKISFTDQGMGFKPEYNERIFEIFQQLAGKEKEGTGIGLASCKKIIENYHGRITASSVEGKGATINIYIPA